MKRKLKQSLIPARPVFPAAVLEHARAAASKYAKGSRATSTWRAYASDWRIFNEWCAKVTRPALPAETSTVALFIVSQAKQGLLPPR